MGVQDIFLFSRAILPKGSSESIHCLSLGIALIVKGIVETGNGNEAAGEGKLSVERLSSASVDPTQTHLGEVANSDLEPGRRENWFLLDDEER